MSLGGPGPQIRWFKAIFRRGGWISPPPSLIGLNAFNKEEALLLGAFYVFVKTSWTFVYSSIEGTLTGEEATPIFWKLFRIIIIYINFVKMFVCHFDWGQYKSIYYLIISSFKLERNFNLFIQTHEHQTFISFKIKTQMLVTIDLTSWYNISLNRWCHML